jgi:hypothetical protein
MRKVLVLPLLLSSACLVDVEVDVPETCIEKSDVLIPAAEEGAAPMELVIDSDELSALDQTTVTLLSVELKSDRDLSMLDSVALSRDGVELVFCDQQGCSGGGVIDVGEREEIKLELAIEGELPAEAWTADVKVCFEAKSGFQI